MLKIKNFISKNLINSTIKNFARNTNFIKNNYLKIKDTDEINRNINLRDKKYFDIEPNQQNEKE
jgi:hypothetical protein